MTAENAAAPEWPGLRRAGAARPRLPGTVTFKLTALYGALFLAAGVALLAITYLLFVQQLPAPHPKNLRSPAATAQFRCPGSVGAPAKSAGIGPGVAAPSGSLPSSVPAHPGCFHYSAGDLARQLARAQNLLAQQQSAAVRRLLSDSGIALATMFVIAIGLGWWTAGRVLRPLRAITATARRLSTDNLNERINLGGPDDELRELADTMDAMLARLAAAFEAQRRFVASASHELRTPLTVQRAAVDVALADPRPTVESLRLMARRIQAATQRHTRLIDSLLMLARSERGVERYQGADLAVLAREALAAAGPAIDAQGISVSAALAPARLRGDLALLEALVTNLVANAVHHNIAGGEITVATHANGTRVVIKLANSGPVVPPGRAEQLFQPFSRLAPDRTRPGSHRGFGLGLSIVAAIAAAHEGACTAAPRPGGGLAVTVDLPASPAVSPQRTARTGLTLAAAAVRDQCP